MSTRRTIAVGDIHGCLAALEAICGAVALTSTDTLVILGDVIDRGPDSCGVLAFLLELRERCQLVTILGNHEQMMLDSADGKMALQDWLIHGGEETLDSYGKNAGLSSVPDSHFEYLRTWCDFYETDDHFFAHGNYESGLPLEKQPWHNLRWLSLQWSMPAAHQSGKKAIVGHTANKRGEILDGEHLICIDTYCHGGGWLTAMEPATGEVWQADKHGNLR